MLMLYRAACVALCVLSAPVAAAEIMAGPCPVQPDSGIKFSAKIDCGYVILPMDPTNHTRGIVRIAFMRARSNEGTAKRPPLVMLDGGPGASLQLPSVYGFFGPSMLEPMLKDRDILILDERGTRYSQPKLDCPDFGRVAWTANQAGLADDAAMQLVAKTIGDCAAKVTARGVDLATFNSRVMAADVEAARIAFGYDRLLVYGASYGTILAQHYVRDFPTSVEALILDGTDPLSTRSWSEHRAINYARAFANIAALCKSDPMCNKAYDLEALMKKGMSAFDAGPIPYTHVTKGRPSTKVKVSIDKSSFLEFVYDTMNGQSSFRALPYILDKLTANGRKSMAEMLGPELGAKILASRDPQPGGTASLMHFAVTCSDDPTRSVNDLKVEPDTPDYARVFGEGVAREYAAVCAALDLPELPPETDVIPKPRAPVLMLAGRLDSRTPAYLAEKMARELPRVTLAEFPEGTHVQLGEINLCAFAIVVAFAADPGGTPPPGLDCIGKIPKLGFVMPDGTMSGAPATTDIVKQDAPASRPDP